MTAGLKYYRTIIVGVNGSASSDMAVDTAAMMAAESGARLILVIGYTRGPSEVGVDEILKGDTYLVRGSTPAEEFVRRAGERAVELGAKFVTRCAIACSPDKALLTAAEEAGADLIVLGDSGSGGARRWRQLMPTLLDAVTRKSSVDVLVVSLHSGARRVVGGGTPVLRRPLTAAWDGLRSATLARSRS
ncbi:universal stress protein [Nocardia huaxiensis]|uniref:Universal stress protein n=1 Tax=Nocardia huaxiensis TaxID=2755382 RepID=A0A7D6V9B8_9NOCA|nr:universal stress protein [Nocardia huaxiensis]QLY29573.1 universal stress protein [Nocardia huaxiensis]UFS96861.1 universal stress protein [Nocardia huaxiensis]